ncbi:hypothetical protein [Limobrevibacterium gyesilva]|uniref:Uncharacterized protein n=1 Tax=Limobrevibacterium gyesilva TaxID=2991712 RepID=A0AA41YNB9_9PROT|nr:hypothetical protein [Limobrevibacterium gyesilva]MCW3475522.1 hypothetical protein [Limobrevibacterium gyesilva]
MATASRPPLRTLQQPEGAVLLIDAVDKVDEALEALEALLLEMPSDHQVTIPEIC